MKNKLLITTALVALVSVSNAYAAEPYRKDVINKDTTLSETESNWNGGKTNGGVYFICDDNCPSEGVNVNIKSGSEYNNNTATGSGGAIYMYGGKSPVLNIEDGVIFANNHANTQGGALSVSSHNNEITIGKALFKGNSAIDGGAIIHQLIDGKNTSTLSLNGTQFINNKAVNGEGGAVSNFSTMKVNTTYFEGNEATGNVANGQEDGGGALLLGADSQTTVSNSTFNANKATGTVGGAISTRRHYTNTASSFWKVTNSQFTSNEAKDGGAIFNTFTHDASVADSSFKNNSATNNGGAIHNSKGTLSVTNTEFSSNTAVDGGAVYNGNSGKITKLSGIFSGNASSNRGGAIYNSGTSTIDNIEGTFTGNKADKGGAISNAGVGSTGTILISNSTFRDNAAITGGGAIHNMAKGSLTFKGNNTFSGNKANGVLNDIYNNGQIDVSGTLTLDGGISGTGTTTLAKDSNLNVKTGTTTISNKVVNNGANLSLTFDNGFTGEYKLITDNGTLDKEFNIAENGIYNIQTDVVKKGTYTISKKSTGEISAATGANANQAGAINAITNGSSGSASFNNIANSISNLMQSSNKADVQTALNAATALAPETAAMVQSASSENANQIFNAVGSRLSGGSIGSSSEGMSSGDNLLERGAMWIQSLFNKSKLDDTSKAKGFDADSTGIAFGAEKQINDNVKAGIGYAYTNTDIDGFMRQTDVDTHTAIFYGEYKPSQWYVNGVATYGWSDYSEKKNVAGNLVKADYDVDTIGLQTMTGYEMQVKGINLTPEAGLRYVHISQDGYKDSVDQKVGSNSSDVLTGVIGAKAKKDFVLENGINLRPEARLAMTYDLMNDDTNSVVSLANGSAYQVRGEALDRFGVEVGAGLTADINDNVELSLGYEGKFRQDYQDHTGLLNAKYKF